MQFKLSVPKLYNLQASIHSWIYPDIQPVPELTTETSFARIFTFDDQLVPLRIIQEQPGTEILVRCSIDTVSKRDITTKLIEVLGLSIQTSGALNLIRNDPIISHIIPTISGIRPYQSPTAFEALIKTIIQQQISYRAANILTRKIVLALSHREWYDGIEMFSFPSPDVIFKCGTTGLKSFGLGYKSEYIQNIIKMIQNNELELETLKGKKFHEVLGILKPIRGIGEWTVRTLAIAGLGDYTVFPCDDLGVRNFMSRLYKPNDERMSGNEVEEFAQGWGEDWPLVLYLLMCGDVLGLLGYQGRQQMHKSTPR